MTTNKISDQAKRVFDLLPQDGSKISGIKVKDKLTLSALDYQKAKDELRAEGLVELGKGRGGTIGRVEGVETPEVVTKKTKEESLEIAREEKAARTKAQRELDAMKETAIAAGKKHFPDADDYRPGLRNLDEWYCEVRIGKTTGNYFLTEEDYV